MRVLCVLASSNQLYSGIGRALFEQARRLADRVEYTFAIDDRVSKNVALLRTFGEAHGCAVHVGRALAVPETLDPLNADLPALLDRGGWDAVECVCWADAATHDAVLRRLGRTTLVYTPHSQPIWTVPMSAAEAARIGDVHLRMLRRADLVLCDSPAERREVQARVPDRCVGTFLPLGCDFAEFRPGSWPRRPQLLFVGDLIEPRKRFDRVLAVFARLQERRPELHLVVIGNRSRAEIGRIPAPLRPACELRGYVSEAELRQAYAESLGLFLLSDYEAFGIPILEALASGTPVFLSHQEATSSLFGAYAGAHSCPGDDLEATLAEVERTLDRGVGAIDEVARDRVRLQAAFDWDVLAEQKWEALKAAWFSNHCSTVPA